MEERKAGAPLRLQRAELSRAKFVKSLTSESNSPKEFLAGEAFATLLRGYWATNALESKPDKGERKSADDFLLLIEEYLETLTPVTERKCLTPQRLFRAALLSVGLTHSPDNFDFCLKLV